MTDEERFGRLIRETLQSNPEALNAALDAVIEAWRKSNHEVRALKLIVTDLRAAHAGAIAALDELKKQWTAKALAFKFNDEELREAVELVRTFRSLLAWYADHPLMSDKMVLDMKKEIANLDIWLMGKV
jgi:hypothetical protein